MRYRRTPVFLKSYQNLPPPRQARADHALKKLEMALYTGFLTGGLGLKRLRDDFWEIRAGLSDRIVFRRTRDIIEFSIVGSHDEIKRFLKKI